MKKTNLSTISIFYFLILSTKYLTIPYAPKKIKYKNDILIGTKKKAIRLDAIYTQIDVWILLLIIHTGIKAEAIVNIASVLIGSIEVAYKTIVVNATKIPPSAISLAFIKLPLSFSDKC